MVGQWDAGLSYLLGMKGVVCAADENDKPIFEGRCKSRCCIITSTYEFLQNREKIQKTLMKVLGVS